MQASEGREAEDDAWELFRAAISNENEKMSRYSGLLAILRMVTRQVIVQLH